METDEVRAGLVETAKAYFLKFGYSRVSTGEIADQSGRSKKTLYKHFPTKEALLGAVLARLTTEVETEIVALLDDPSLGAEERVRQVLLRVGAHLIPVIGVLFGDLEQRDPALYAQARQQQRQPLAALLCRLVQTGVDAGIFRRNLDIPALVESFLSTLESIARPATVAANADQPTALFRSLVGWFIAGLK